MPEEILRGRALRPDHSHALVVVLRGGVEVAEQDFAQVRRVLTGQHDNVDGQFFQRFQAGRIIIGRGGSAIVAGGVAAGAEVNPRFHRRGLALPVHWVLDCGGEARRLCDARGQEVPVRGDESFRHLVRRFETHPHAGRAADQISGGECVAIGCVWGLTRGEGQRPIPSRDEHLRGGGRVMAHRIGRDHALRRRGYLAGLELNLPGVRQYADFARGRRRACAIQDGAVAIAP